jgi:predicted  nucleic acid-binding Zn-ribbon protein
MVSFLGTHTALRANFMNQAASIMQSLRNLARLDAELRNLSAGTPDYQEHKNRVALLRAPLPTSILVHYDQRIARGKPGIAPVQGGVCGSCHLSLPSGRLADLRSKPQEVNVCDHCGAFIYLAEVESAPAGNASRQTPARRGLKTRGTR